MKSLLKLIVLVPIVIVVTVLAIANRAAVPVVVDPFGWLELPPVSVPLFVLIFVAVALGVVIGGSAVWLAQGRYRKAARANARVAARQKAELDRMRSGDGAAALPAPSTIR